MVQIELFSLNQLINFLEWQKEVQNNEDSLIPIT